MYAQMGGAHIRSRSLLEVYFAVKKLGKTSFIEEVYCILREMGRRGLLY